MAYDAFLKLDGIDGEVTAKGFEKWIEVMSFSWGVSNAGSHASGGGGGAGKASFQDLNFTQSLSKASPKLMLSCASGEHIKSAILSLRKAGGDTGAQNVFLKIELTDVLVSSFQEAGAEGGDSPEESASLNFVKIDMTYTAPDGEVVRAGWDISKNQGG